MGAKWNGYNRELGALELSGEYARKFDEYRFENNLTVVEAASHMGISRQTYYNWRNGRLPRKGTRSHMNRMVGMK